MRSPRKDPAPGDVLTFPIGKTLRGEFRVRAVVDGTVYYRDEGVFDYVPLEKWRSWFVGRRGVVVKKRGAE